MTDYTIDDKAKPITYDLLEPVTINDGACNGTGGEDDKSISSINDGVGQQEGSGSGDSVTIDDVRTTSCNNEEDDNYDDEGGSGGGSGGNDSDNTDITIDDDSSGDGEDACSKDDTDTESSGGCDSGGSDDDSDGVEPDPESDNSHASLTSETFTGTTSISVSLGSCKMIGGTGTITYSLTDCEESGEASISCDNGEVPISMGAAPATAVRFAPITQTFSVGGFESADGQPLSFTLNISLPSGASGNASVTIFYYDNYTCGKKYKITASVSGATGGTISPVGEIYVEQGQDQAFTMTPAEGQIVSDVKIDGVSRGSITKYTFKKVGRDHTIEAFFTGGTGVPMITVTHGDNGLVCPDGNVAVAYGGSKTFKFVPDPGYGVSEVLVDGVSHGKIATYTFSGVTGPHTLDVQFSKGLTYTITVSNSGSGGTITPPGQTFQVGQGTTQKFFFTPSGNNVAKSVTVDGKKYNCGESFTFNNIGMDHSLNVEFGTGDFTIEATADEHSTISPSGSISVKSGGTKTFLISTATGYAIDKVMIDGKDKGAVRSVTFNNIKHNHTVSVVTKPADFILAINKTGNGTVLLDGDPVSGTIGLTKGESISLEFKPANKLTRVKSVKVDGKRYDGAKTLTFSNIDANHNVNVSFGSYDYTLNIVKEGNGKIIPSEASVGVNAGCKRTLTFEADAGYYLDHIEVDGNIYGASSDFTFNRVGKSHEVKVVFVQGSGVHKVTITKDGPGECDPFGEQDVEHGDELSVSMSADDDAYLEKVTVDGKDMGRPTGFTFKGVGKDHTLLASFKSSPSYKVTVTCPTTAVADPLYAEVLKCDDVDINIEAIEGYHIKDVSVDGKSFGSVSGVAFTEVGHDHDIIISTHDFETGKFKITVASEPADKGCKLSPEKEVFVAQGESTDVTCFPSEMWVLSDTLVDDESIGAVDSISFQNIGKDHDVKFKLIGPGQLSITADILEEDTGAPLPATLASSITIDVSPENGGEVKDLTYGDSIAGSGPAKAHCEISTGLIDGENPRYKISVNVSPTDPEWQSGGADVVAVIEEGSYVSDCYLKVYLKGPGSDWEEWDATITVIVTGAGNKGTSCDCGNPNGPISGGTLTITGERMVPTSGTLKGMGSGKYTGTFHFKTKVDEGKQAETELKFSKTRYASVESGLTVDGNTEGNISVSANLTSQEDDRLLPQRIVVRHYDQMCCDKEGNPYNRLFQKPVTFKVNGENEIASGIGFIYLPETLFQGGKGLKGYVEPASSMYGPVEVDISAETAGSCDPDSTPETEIKIPCFWGALQVTVKDSETEKPIERVTVSTTQGVAGTTDANGRVTIAPIMKGTATVTASKLRYATNTETMDVDTEYGNSYDIMLEKNMGDLTVRLFAPNSTTQLFTGTASVTISKDGVYTKTLTNTTGQLVFIDMPYGDNYKISVDAGIYIDKEEYSYSFSGKTYENINLSNNLTPDPGNSATLRVTVLDSETYKPIPCSVRLVKRSDLSEIGNKSSETGLVEFNVLTAEEYTIEASAVDYKPASMMTTIGDWIVEEEISLDPIPDPASLKFTVYKGYDTILTNPVSTITVKSEVEGTQTLTTVDGIAECTVQSEQSIGITCACGGYEPYKSTEYPDAGANNIEVHMTKIKSTTGNLIITLKDANTNNLITGESITVRFGSVTPITTTNGFATFNNVPNGSYTIYASGPVYEEGHSYVYIDGEDVEEEVTLTHKPIPVKVTLRFNNADKGVSITNPATVKFGDDTTENVTAGFITNNSVEPNKTYTITIKALGFKTLTTSRYIAEGDDFDETFDLYPGRDPVTDPVTLTVTLYNANARGTPVKEYASIKVPALGEEKNTSVGYVTIDNMPKGTYLVQAEVAAFNNNQSEVPVFNKNTKYDFYMTPLDPDLPGTCGVVFQHQFPTGTSKPEIKMTNYLGSVNYQTIFENLEAYPYYLRKTEVKTKESTEFYDYVSDINLSGITQIVRVTFHWYCKPGIKKANVDNLNYPSYSPIPEDIQLIFNGKEFPTRIKNGEVIQFTRAYDTNNTVVNGKQVYDAFEYLYFCPNLWNENIPESKKLHQVPNIIYAETDGNCKVKLTLSMNYYKGYYDDDDRPCNGPTCDEG